MNNPLDKYLTRVQSGAIIGLILMLQMGLFLNSPTKSIMGFTSSFLGIIGFMFFILAIIVYVFTGEYKKPTLRSLLTLS